MATAPSHIAFDPGEVRRSETVLSEPASATTGCSREAPPQESWASLHVLSSAYLEPWETGRVDDSVRFDAACQLDGQLLHIAALEIPCRILLSRLARAMTTRRGWQRLGFSRIGDYTSERLGLKARCVQEDVRVISALDDLPRIRSALCHGEIRWTSARIVTRIATAADESFWLDRARTRTTRQLDAEVKEARKARREAVDDSEQRVESTSQPNHETGRPDIGSRDQETAAPSVSQADHEKDSPEIRSPNLSREDPGSTAPTTTDTHCNDPHCNDPTPNDPHSTDTTEESERVLWKLRCSHRGRRRWRQVRELAERMAGSRLTGEQVLELVCAEVSAFLPPEPSSIDAATAQDAQRDKILAGQRKPPPDFFSTTGWTTEQRIAAFESETGVSEGFTHALPPTQPLAERLPLELAALAVGLDDGFSDDGFSRGGCGNDGPTGDRFSRDESSSDRFRHDGFSCEGVRGGVDDEADGDVDKGDCDPMDVNALGSPPASDGGAGSLAAGDLADLDEIVDGGFNDHTHNPGNPNSRRKSPSLAPPDAFELDRRLRIVQRAIQSLDWQLGTVLRSLVDHRLYRDLGFASFRLYCDARLGIDSRKANQLVRLERSTWQHSPLLRNAYREGRISRLAALTILPVLSRQHAAAWIERAGEVTLRRLCDEVAWSAEQMDEPPYGRPIPPPPSDLDVHRELFGPPVFASPTGSPVSPTNQGALNKGASDEGTSGERVLGQTTSGEAAAAERVLGKTTSGAGAAGERAPGETTSGEGAAGERAPGETTSGEAAAGERAPGETTSGEAASDEGAAKKATTDQTAMNSGAADEAAVDGNATSEEAAHQGASEEGSMRTLLGRERDPDLFGGARITIEADIDIIIFLEETLDRASRFLESRLRASEQRSSDRSPDRPVAGWTASDEAGSLGRGLAAGLATGVAAGLAGEAETNAIHPTDPASSPRRISRWQVFEWLLEQAAAEWCAQPCHRDPVFAREGWRCSVPCCSTRRELEDHHIVFRSHGGGNEVTNRIAVCHWHHHHAIHEGTVRASGPAPRGVRWQLGCRHRGADLFDGSPRADGRPLLKLFGERYQK